MVDCCDLHEAAVFCGIRCKLQSVRVLEVEEEKAQRVGSTTDSCGVWSGRTIRGRVTRGEKGDSFQGTDNEDTTSTWYMSS